MWSQKAMLAFLLLLTLLVVKADEPVLTEVTWESYNENVLNDPHVVLIQYYSKSNKDCTNCEAFQSQWKDLRDDLPGVKFAAVDVDTEAGNETALKTGALIGIPHLRLQYHGTDYLSLMDEALAPNDQLIAMINAELSSHEKDSNGMYLKKKNSEEL
eukprot:g10074.t1